MQRDDFIKRLIRQFTRFLLKIIGLIDDNDYAQALETIEEVRESVLGINALLIYHLPIQDLIGLFTVAENVDTGKLLMLAELFNVEGDVYAAMGKPEKSETAYFKALDLYLEIYLLTEVVRFPEEFSTIESIDDKIDTELPFGTAANLFTYYEDAGQYARAEEALFAYIETTPTPEESLEEGRAFFERMKAKSDEDLTSGGLSRTDMEQGLAELLTAGKA